MSLEVNIPTETFELIFGQLKDKSDEQIVNLLSDGIEEAFSNAAGIAVAESKNCKLKYLDITTSPFKDLGDWRKLANISIESTKKISSDAACITLSLPFSEGPIETLKMCAPAFNIPQLSYTDTVNSLLLLSYSISKLSHELDQDKIKPVIRGLEVDLENLKNDVSFPGMGGIIDTPESVNSIEVWAHSQNRPDSIPLFFILMIKTTPNKQVKRARYHSLGLLKSGAVLCFLKAPYLSR